MALRLLQEAQREAAELRAALVASETETLRLQAQNRRLLAELGVDADADPPGRQSAEAGGVGGRPTIGEVEAVAGSEAEGLKAEDSAEGPAAGSEVSGGEPAAARPKSPARRRLV